MRRFCFAIFVLSALSFASLPLTAPVHADDWAKTYKLTGRPNLRVITNDGHVDLYASTGNEINAHVTTNGWPIGDRGVRIIESQTGNDVNLEVHVPTFHFSFGWNNRSVRIELHVPREADFDIQTSDGSVTSQAFHGQLRISTGDGNIEANGLTGNVRLHSGDGHIRGDGFDGALDADSGDGRIDVTGRFDTLRLQSGDGSVTAEAQSGSKISSDWSIRSGDGSVTLRLPDGLNADLDAHTGDGRITLDFPVTVQGDLSRTTIRGKIGAGGPPLLVHTGDGSIHISKI
ncbi:MAG TPA: DUF4097 family beta strand repeat-containing protein [Candidatus Acidoferrales bacterium]|nr:DUF4097 family beta strand repeat-containing protein [Candidatus Acidoferrales bacterium]